MVRVGPVVANFPILSFCLEEQRNESNLMLGEASLSPDLPRISRPRAVARAARAGSSRKLEQQFLFARKATMAAKKASPYNAFMKTEIAKVKLTTPGIAHKEAFKKAASNWATAPENPKNKPAAK